MAVTVNIPSEVSQSITNGVTDKAPSENVVFDALATKENVLGFTPENTANKQNSLTVDGTGVKFVTVDAVNSGLSGKQDTLVSGANIKTINGSSVLGSGDIVLSSGITIGTTPISSGTDGRILFQSGGVLSQSANLTYDSSLAFVIGNNTIGYVKTSTQNISGANVGEITNYSLNNFPLVKLTGSNLSTYFGGRVGLYHGNTEKAFLRASSTGGEISGFNSILLRVAGSLSSDMGIKVRNSANTANLFEQRGDTTFDFPTYLGGYQGGLGSEVRMGNAGTFYTQANQFVVTGSSVVTATNGAFIQDSVGQNVLFNSRFVGTSQISLNMGRAIIHLGGLTADTHTGHNILGIANGAAPSASYTDRFMLYSADIVAGNAAPHFRTENGDVQKIYSIGGWGTPTGTLTRTTFDTTTVTLGQLAERVAALISDLKTGHGLLKA